MAGAYEAFPKVRAEGPPGVDADADAGALGAGAAGASSSSSTLKAAAAAETAPVGGAKPSATSITS